VRGQLAGLLGLVAAAILICGCGSNTETVATTANCAGLPGKDYWSCVEEEATNDKWATGSPMTEDEEAERNGTSPP
jgi:hypothetical protein